MATLNITEDNISNIIKSLNPNKSRYWGGISIKFIQLCGKSIPRFLKLIFKSCSAEGIFLDAWENESITHVHKKESRNKLKDHRPNPLKINLQFYLAIIAFCNILVFYMKLSITLTKSFEIYKRIFFLIFAKHFIKFHPEFLFKLKCYGTDVPFQIFFPNYLSNNKKERHL